MTEKNAYVEWFRLCEPFRKGADLWVPTETRDSIIAYIFQLEADQVKDQLRIEALQDSVDGCAQRLAAEVSRRSVPNDRRPTVHEIAAGNMQGIMARGTGGYASWQDAAVDAYDAAAALVAEGRRRDGNA